MVDGGDTAVGTVRGMSGDYGIAYIQLAAVGKAEAGSTLQAKSGAVVQPYRPRWWPAEWGREEEMAQAASGAAGGAAEGK